jgi:hypothetical protein
MQICTNFVLRFDHIIGCDAVCAREFGAKTFTFHILGISFESVRLRSGDLSLEFAN